MAKTRQALFRAFTFISGGLLALLFSLYLVRPDWAAAITLLPPLFWFVLGGLLTAPTLINGRVFSVLLASWLIFGLIFVEGFRSSLRPGFRIASAERASHSTLRLISLNCAGGSIEAAEEVGAYEPDVVFFQETPPAHEVRELARKIFGSEAEVCVGPDAAIIARATLKALALPRGTHNFVMTDASLQGQDVQLVSLRLLPPVGRVDLWTPEAWTAQRANRGHRRAELQEIVRYIEKNRRQGPLIVAGDFNAVAGDPSLRPIGFLSDSFDLAGRGWPDTAVNDYPFARIDRIYVSEDVEVLASTVRKTEHSDHRMLIVDVRVNRK